MSKKHFFCMLALMSFMAVSSTARPVRFTVGIDDTTGTMPDYSKIPPAPVVDLNDNVLTFLPGHDDYTVSIVDEEGSEVYSVFVPTSVTTVTLPFMLGGNYMLQLLTDDFYYFYATFSDLVELDGLYYRLLNKAKTAQVEMMVDETSLSDIVIPESLNYFGNKYSVTSIAPNAFKESLCLTSVTIPASIERIEHGAFYNCISLKAVFISNLAKWCNIEFKNSSDNPLSYAHHLYLDGVEVTNLVIPDGVEKISEWAFYGCDGLASVDTGRETKTIGSGAFRNCTVLKDVTIGSSVKTIEGSAFEGCCNLDSVSFGNSVTTISGGAFSGCKLESVILPNSVTTLGSNVFKDCTELKWVTLGTGLKELSLYAFYGCKNLIGLNISDLAVWFDIDITNHEYSYEKPVSYYRLFLNGKELKDLVIPDGVTTINPYLFYCCNSLVSVTIPSGVTKIGDWAFAFCKNILSVAMANSVNTLGTGAFYDCEGLTSLTVSDGVTDISLKAFQFCTNLRNVILPSKLEIIGDDAFQKCGSLQSITIPNSTTAIGSGSFYKCSRLTTVTVGSGVKSISYYAFASCPELANIYCFAAEAPESHVETFQDSYSEYCNLYVPAASVEAYKARIPWNSFKIAPLTDEDIINPESRKCATPTISFVDGELSFSCETDGVEFVAEITADEARKYYSDKVKLDGKYIVKVYAVKRDFEDSDVTTAVIYPGQNPSVKTIYDVNRDGTVDVADISAIITAMAQ